MDYIHFKTDFSIIFVCLHFLHSPTIHSLKTVQNERESPRQRGDEIERGRNFGGMAWFEAWIADFRFS